MIKFLLHSNFRNKKRIPFFLLIGTLFLGNGMAQTGSVSGRIEDASTGEGLIGAVF